MQELHLQIRRASGELTQQLGRSLTVADLAACLQTRYDDILEALEAAQAYRTLSLDTPARGDDDGDHGIGDTIGAADPDFERVEVREALRPLLAQLSAREQRIIALRFFGNLTQSQIAAQVGLSQMHVSRLLTHALGVLRAGLLKDYTTAPAERRFGCCPSCGQAVCWKYLDDHDVPNSPV